MSWDLFAMRFPSGTNRFDEVPHGYEPPIIGPRSEVVAAIAEVLPEADLRDPTWGRVDGLGFSIELNIGDDPITCIALHVRGGDDAVPVVAAILDRLGLQAAHSGDGTGDLFDPATAADALAAWRAYRDSVLPPPS